MHWSDMTQAQRLYVNIHNAGKGSAYMRGGKDRLNEIFREMRTQGMFLTDPDRVRALVEDEIDAGCIDGRFLTRSGVDWDEFHWRVWNGVFADYDE